METNESQRGERIKHLREVVLKISQKAFSDLLNLNQSHLSGIENGKRPVSTSLIDLLYERYYVSSNWILFGEGEMFAESLKNLTKLPTNFAHLNLEFLHTQNELPKKSKQTVDFFPVSVPEMASKILFLSKEGQNMFRNILEINELILSVGDFPYSEEQSKHDEAIAYQHLDELVKNMGKSPLEGMSPDELWSYQTEVENRYQKLKNRFFERFLILYTVMIDPKKANELKAKYEESEGK